MYLLEEVWKPIASALFPDIYHRDQQLYPRPQFTAAIRQHRELILDCGVVHVSGGGGERSQCASKNLSRRFFPMSHFFLLKCCVYMCASKAVVVCRVSFCPPISPMSSKIKVSN